MTYAKVVPHVRFEGNFVSLIAPKKSRTKSIVSKQFLKLWFATIRNEFDPEIYELMDEKNRKFFITVYSFWTKRVPEGAIQPSFEIYRSDISKPFVDRLRVIEGEMLAGNLNPELIDQYAALLAELVDYHFMTGQQRTILLKRVRATHAMLDSAEAALADLEIKG